MRKVFIIGNGFDRAHGLETSYQHLIDYYKSKVFWRLRSETSYADSFLKVDLPGPPLEHEHYERHGPRNFDELEKHTETKGEVLEYKGSFMSDLIKHYNDSNWVDIEYYYFLKLKQVALNDTPTMEWKKESLVALNAQFKALKGLLTEYLDSTNLKVKPIDGFQNIFKTAIRSAKCLFVNFNYTNTLAAYLSYGHIESNFEVVNIHGQLNDVNNPIIFGYGDQHDDAYSVLENFNDPEFLKFIKYPKYTLTPGFSKISSFNQDPYEVDIIGHSCGLSDRTLFREILDNDNCKKITIYFHKDRNDFESKATELTRHFNKKIDLPRKLTPFNENLLCPQKPVI